MSNAVVIERTVNAPIGTVWNLWTDADHFAKWYGPMGAKVPHATIDATVGGKRLICMEMETPKGKMQMWFTGEFVEVSPQTRLVYTDLMSDSDGNPLPPREGQPASTTVIIELEDLGAQTKMKLVHEGVPADSPGASGWNQAIDGMMEYAASL